MRKMSSEGAAGPEGCREAASGEMGATGGTTRALAAGAVGKAGAVNVCEHNGHFINWPAYCSGMVSIFWQLGH
jgi:hypothetical protein